MINIGSNELAQGHDNNGTKDIKHDSSVILKVKNELAQGHDNMEPKILRMIPVSY